MTQQPFLRPNTGDRKIWENVFENNEYGIGDMTGKTVIDIGANIGAFSCLAAAKGAAKVLCIEPFKSNFQSLVRNCASYPSISPLELAISGNDDESLQLCNESEYISQFKDRFPEREAIEMAGVHVDSVEATSGTAVCRTVTLDTLIWGWRHIPTDLLKIDCEGGEWKMFAHTPYITFSSVGEIIGEYHLGPETVREELGPDVDPLPWLNGLLKGFGFNCTFKENVNNKNVGWFHAVRPGVSTPFARIPGLEPLEPISIDRIPGCDDSTFSRFH